MLGFRTIIAGSRTAPRQIVLEGIERTPWKHLIVQVVSGTAQGADRHGEDWATLNGIPVSRFPAQWQLYGRSAGHRRNKVMAQNADCLIAIW